MVQLRLRYIKLLTDHEISRKYITVTIYLGRVCRNKKSYGKWIMEGTHYFFDFQRLCYNIIWMCDAYREKGLQQFNTRKDLDKM